MCINFISKKYFVNKNIGRRGKMNAKNLMYSV